MNCINDKAGEEQIDRSANGGEQKEGEEQVQWHQFRFTILCHKIRSI